MGWRRFLKEDAERKVEWERIQVLENEKLRREAEALAKLASERKEARQREQSAKPIRSRPSRKPLSETVGISASSTPAPAAPVPLSTSLRHRITAKILQSEEEAAHGAEDDMTSARNPSFHAKLVENDASGWGEARIVRITEQPPAAFIVNQGTGGSNEIET
jgi:hypothetical protein